MDRKDTTTDVLIIGGGGAGLRAAIEARENGADVVVASKAPAGSPNSTTHTAGWFTHSTVEGEDELFRQVVQVGGYLNNQRLVEVFVKEVTKGIPQLKNFGVELVVERPEGSGPERPGHQYIPRSPGRLPGFRLTWSLRGAAERMGAKFLDSFLITRLITSGEVVVGATGVDLTREEFLTISAKSAVLATGGGACIYERADNPPGTTGDGLALAYRAGAELVDMECITFYLPTERFEEIFKGADESLLKVGNAHYFSGGIRIDDQCRTTVEGLYAAGEITGGLFGAARLGGAALADVIVFGARAGKNAALRAKGIGNPELDVAQVEGEKERLEGIFERDGTPPLVVKDKVRSIMWRYAGMVKTEDRLSRALEELAQMRAQIPKVRAQNAEELRDAQEASNILDAGKLIVAASLERKETRGTFWRVDHPRPDNANWVRNIILYRDGEHIGMRIEPAVMTRLHSPSEPPVGFGCFEYL